MAQVKPRPSFPCQLVLEGEEALHIQPWPEVWLSKYPPALEVGVGSRMDG